MSWRAGLIGWGLAFALVSGAPASPAHADGGFYDWAAVVVAGDWRAHSGSPTEAFDNARRDVAAALIGASFEADNLRQFSVRPQRYRDVRPAKSDIQGVYDGLVALTARTRAGCLFYVSSHGAPQGVLVGDDLLDPATLEAMLDDTCAARPTVVVLSACFSGVFVPQLARPHRMILTAARADRTSFGCGEADTYPYFDECFLRSFPHAPNFATLGAAVQACVGAREIKEGALPPSEPQLWIGAALRPLLPLYRLAHPPP